MDAFNSSRMKHAVLAFKAPSSELIGQWLGKIFRPRPLWTWVFISGYCLSSIGVLKTYIQDGRWPAPTYDLRVVQQAYVRHDFFFRWRPGQQDQSFPVGFSHSRIAVQGRFDSQCPAIRKVILYEASHNQVHSGEVECGKATRVHIVVQAV